MDAFMKSTTFVTKYLWAEATKRPRNLGLGTTVVLFTTFFISVVLIGVTKSPVVFLRLVELGTSEMDTIILTNPDQSLPFVNATDVGKRLDGSKAVTGAVPRWLLPATMRARFNRTSSVKNISVRIVMVDTDAEESIGLGRAWPHRPLGRGEIHVQESVMDSLKLKANRGDRVIIEIDLFSTLEQQGVGVSSLPLTLDGAQARTIVEDAILSPLGVGANTTLTIPLGDVVDAVNTTTNGTLNIPLPDAIRNITINITAGQLLDALAGQNINAAVNTLLLQGLVNPTIEFSVVDSVSSAEGKYPNSLGNVVLIDYREIIPHILDNVCYNRLQAIGGSGLPSEDSISENFRLQDFSLLSAVMFTGRIDTYLMDKTPRNVELIKKTNDMMYDLGLRYNATFQWPIPLALDAVYFFQLFLNQIFYSSIFIIAILSFLVVYILLLTTAEERSYENGMLRAMGLSTSALMQLLVSQGLAFAIPAVAVALLLAYIANAIAEGQLETLTKIPPRYNAVPSYTIILPAVAGIVVPVVSNIVPVRSALSKSLRDSLDRYHTTTNEVSVSIVKLQDLGIAPWQTVLGILLIIGGFMVYYLVPYSFIFDQLFLFFLLMIIILLAMLIGLCMISQALQPYLEKLTLFVLIPPFKKYSPDYVLRHIVQKNLDAHRTRNQLSYLMFTVSVASVVFGGVTFALMDAMIKQNTELFVGSDIMASTLLKNQPLNRTLLGKELETLKSTGQVEEYAFLTFPLNQHDGVTTSTVVSNLVNFPSNRILVYGVDRSYQRATFSKYFLTTDVEGGFQGKDLVASLYDRASDTQKDFTPPPPLYTGFVQKNDSTSTLPDITSKYSESLSCIMSAAMKDSLSLTTSVYGLLSYSKKVSIGLNDSDTNAQTYLYRPRALAYKLPGFAFVSSYSFGVANSPFLISQPMFMRLLPLNSTVLYSKLFVKVKPGSSRLERLAVMNRVSTFLDATSHQIIDVQEQLDGTKIATDLLNAFLYFLCGVAMILDTIMLWLAFITNVKMNSWSLAVLRSLGLKIGQMYRVFIYEALCLVLSSFGVGIVVGSIIAITLALQFNLFTELPFELQFPYGLTLALFVLCMISAVLASWIPTNALVKRQIAQVLKSG